MAEEAAKVSRLPPQNDCYPREQDTRASWIVAGACFIIAFVTFGLLRCYGLLYVSVLQVFASSREAASWPFSVSAASMNLMGPIAGLLNRRFGCRRVVLVGCTTAMLGSAACFWAPNVLFLTIFFGILQGASCGVVMLQVPVTVNQHFVRYRTTAQGVAFSGATVATFIYPPLLEYMVREYGIRGTFLLVGSILLQGAIGGSLIRPTGWNNQRAASWTPEPIKERSSRYRCSDTSIPDNILLEQEVMEVKDVNYNRAGGLLSQREPKISFEVQQLTEARPLGHWAMVKSPWEIERDTSEDSREQTQILLPPPPLPCTHKGFPRVLVVRSVPDSHADPDGLQCRHGSCSPDSVIMSARDEVLLRPCASPLPTSALSLVRGIFENPIFWLLTLSWASFLFAYITYILVIVDCVKDNGIHEEDALFLFSAFSIGDLFGRLGFGWVTDRGYIRRKNFTLTTSATLGVTLVLLPLEWSYGFQMTVSVVIGMSVGSTMILYVSLVADYMRPDQIAMTLGLIGFFNGCFSLGRPFLVGYFRDVHGSYNSLFFTVGGLTVICAFSWLLEPAVLKWDRNRKSRPY